MILTVVYVRESKVSVRVSTIFSVVTSVKPPVVDTVYSLSSSAVPQSSFYSTSGWLLSLHQPFTSHVLLI